MNILVIVLAIITIIQTINNAKMHSEIDRKNEVFDKAIEFAADRVKRVIELKTLIFEAGLYIGDVDGVKKLLPKEEEKKVKVKSRK